MKDTILRGTGNSRTLRSVSNFLTLYPTYNAFAQALVQGTLPIDIGALNSAGLTTRGTDLNKANILTDATATGMGLTSSATQNDAFAKLSALVKAAQADADTALSTGVFMQTGTYTGDGQKTKTIHFAHPWHVFGVKLLDRADSANTVAFYGSQALFIAASSTGNITLYNLGLAYDETQITITAPDYNHFPPNYNGQKYSWWAI